MSDKAALEGEEIEITPEEIAQAADEFTSSIIDADTLFLEDVDGRKEFLVFDGEDRARLTVYSDCTALQEANKKAYNEPINKGCEFRWVARLDTGFLDIYGFDHGLPLYWYYKREYGDLLMRIAHDPDYRDFRTSPGNYIRRGT